MSTISAAFCSPQDCPDAGDQFARVEGLGDIVVGADLETDNAVDVGATRRQHDDGQRRLRPQSTTDAEAILTGQLYIEHDEVDRLSRHDDVHIDG